jgi:copper homeostasis protein
MILEVIATSVMDAKLAQEYGANRIELISGILEGGLTPSYGLIEQVMRAVTIPVHVMVRPHANSFCYDEDDLAVMLRDIRIIREMGAAGIVLGALKPDKQIDTLTLERLLSEISETSNISVTFHRAFDELEDQQAGLHKLSCFPSIRKVLTSGGKRNVLDAKLEIAALVKESVGLPIEIVAGSGLSVRTLDEFLKLTGAKEIHMGTGVRVNGHALEPIDKHKLQSAAAIIACYNVE